MRLLISLILFPAIGLAADATFTWQKPVPAFTGEVPPGVIIDEYRIYCFVETGESYVISVSGYDTERHDATGLPAGSTTCYMRSYSAALDLESVNSNEVTKILYETPTPNPPNAVDFSAVY